MSETIPLLPHQATSKFGRLGARLAAKGYRLELRPAALGEELPETLEGYGGIVTGLDGFLDRWLAPPLAAAAE